MVPWGMDGRCRLNTGNLAELWTSFLVSARYQIGRQRPELVVGVVADTGYLSLGEGVLVWGWEV